MNLSIYLHFPFCKKRCGYCNFYKEIYQSSLEAKFFKALSIETELAAAALGNTYKEVSTIFIGGGTPSMSNLELLADWIQLLKKYFHIQNGIEFSIEANPETINLNNLKQLKTMGLTRPTFGIQTFDPKMLEILNRHHNPHDSQQAIYLTNALGFKTFGVDLLFALPNQTLKMFNSDLDQLLELEPPHISLYQLIIEEDTPLMVQFETGRFKAIDNDLSAAMFRGAIDKMTHAGYVQYEIASFAKAGHECRHNLNYWQGGNYLALGPSGHSFIDNQRFYNVSDLDNYCDSLNNKHLPRQIDESGINERITEAIYLELRTKWGIRRDKFVKRFALSFDDKIDLEEFNRFVELQHIIDDGETVRLSSSGMILADEIITRLLK